MSVMTSVCAWIVTHSAESTFRTRDIVNATGIDVSQVSNSLRTLTDTGAVRIVTGNAGRGGNTYRVAELQAVRLRSFAGNKPAREPEPAPALVDGEVPGDTGQDFLTYALDHDGDLQIIQPDGEAFTIDNENARRLVAFVALQASAILMAGSQ